MDALADRKAGSTSSVSSRFLESNSRVTRLVKKRGVKDCSNRHVAPNLQLICQANEYGCFEYYVNELSRSLGRVTPLKLANEVVGRFDFRNISTINYDTIIGHL